MTDEKKQRTSGEDVIGGPVGDNVKSMLAVVEHSATHARVLMHVLNISTVFVLISAAAADRDIRANESARDRWILDEIASDYLRLVKAVSAARYSDSRLLIFVVSLALNWIPILALIVLLYLSFFWARHVDSWIGINATFVTILTGMAITIVCIKSGSVLGFVGSSRPDLKLR